MAAMRMLDFGNFLVWTNLAIYGGAAIVVWLAGTRLATYADAIGDRTKLSKAFLGLILLGAATSLPEIATTVLRMGYDSVAVLAAYGVGLVGLYYLGSPKP